jgi:hypothetical protein
MTEKAKDTLSGSILEGYWRWRDACEAFANVLGRDQRIAESVRKRGGLQLRAGGWHFCAEPETAEEHS